MSEAELIDGGNGQLVDGEEKEVALTQVERERFTKLTTVIKEWIGFYVVVGAAIKEVIEKRLYRQDYDSVEAWGLDVMGLSKRKVYYLMSSFDMVSDDFHIDLSDVDNDSQKLCTIVHSGMIPKNEGQARALLQAPKEKRAEIWQKAVSTAPEGKITAKHIKQTIAQATGEQVTEKIKKAKDAAQKGKLMSDDFSKAFQHLLDQLELSKKGNYKSTSRAEIITHLEALAGVIAQDGPDQLKIRGCTMQLSDREKLLEAGFRIFKKNPGKAVIEEYEFGDWVMYSDHIDNRESLEDTFEQLMTEPKNLRG